MPGRKGRGNKSGVEGPGVLVVDGKHRYKYNKVSKDGLRWRMTCVEQTNPEYSCSATAMVIKRLDDGRFFLLGEKGDHIHDVNKAAIIAEELKLRMVDIVKKDPSAPVGEAIKATKKEMAEEFGHDDQLFKNIASEIGTNHALEQRLLRVREKIIGALPKNRDRFDPRHFLKRVFKKKGEDVVILDSNKLPENWRDILEKENTNSDYNWEKKTDLQKHEVDESKQEDHSEESVSVEDIGFNEDEGVSVEDIGPDEDEPARPKVAEKEVNIVGLEPDDEEQEEDESQPEESDSKEKDLPKRVLAYSTVQLLQLFSKCQRGSLDGTFKSCCKMWGQQFVWMLKYNGKYIIGFIIHVFPFFGTVNSVLIIVCQTNVCVCYICS